MYFKVKQQYYSKQCEWYVLQFVEVEPIDQLYCKSQPTMGLICFFKYKAEDITLTWKDFILY